MTTIVRAGEDDWQTVRAIRLAALTADPSAFGSTLQRELAYPEDRWRGWATRPGGACFLAVEPDATVGLVTVKALEEPDAVELNALWVDPEHRGTGTGAALVAAVADWARAQGKQRLLLWGHHRQQCGHPVVRESGLRTDRGRATVAQRRPADRDPVREGPVETRPGLG